MSAIFDILNRPRAVPLGIAALVLSYWLLRLFGFPALGGDEAEQVLFAQTYRWGYDVANPPLYTWILIALFGAMGKSAAAVLALKFAVLGLVYVSLHEAAKLALGPERKRDAVLVALSPLLIFFIAWHAIFSYSHSLLNALFVIWAFIAFVKVVEAPSARAYAALGLVLGLGMITKYSFALFALGLFGAGLSIAETRARILDKRMALALAVGALVLSPHGLWMAGKIEAMQTAIDYKLQVGAETSYAAGVGKGLWNILRATFAFMSPLWLVVLVLFPGVFKPAPMAQERGREALYATLLGRTFLGILGLMVAMVVFGSITQFRPNYLFLMVLFPLWVFLRLPAEPQPGRRRRIYGALALGGAVLSVTGLGVKVVADPLTCKKCQLQIPYEDIAQALRARGFTGGTLFATWHPAPLPGNLALYLDEARTVSKKFLAVRPPHGETPGQCLSVWIPDEQGGPDTENALGSTEGNFDLVISRDEPIERLRFPLPNAPDKFVLIDYVLLDPGQGDCR